MKKNLLFFLILIPLILVFKQFFLSGPLVWGDAPNFAGQEIKELATEPLAWTNRGNSFGSGNNSLWIFPVLSVFGILSNFLNLSGDLLIRILFYFPSVVFACISSFVFSKKLKLGKITQFFTVLTYVLNTYFILLIDGGQVGVALSYGLFPFSVLFLKKFIDDNNINNFFKALFFWEITTIADPRLSLISLFVIVLWIIIELRFRKILLLMPLVVAWLGINLYWIYPLINNIGFEELAKFGKPLISWYYPFSLFSPHWPNNLFGKISKPPLYFVGFTIFIFTNLFLKKYKSIKSIFILFLLSGVLAIGIINFEKIPFGIAFRDSTKFFTPLMLFAGILIGNTVQNFYNRFSSVRFKYLFFALIYFYYLFTLKEALLGRLNFVLSNRIHSEYFQQINNTLISDTSFYRTLWFPERHPLTYETKNNPAVDAKDLINFLPFSSLNASEDQFNFLNFPNYVQKLRELGVKYLILSNNPRELNKTIEENKDWLTINKLILETKELKNISKKQGVPIYEIENSYPRFYFVKNLNAVLGSILINGQMPTNAVYFEDGVTNPEDFQGKEQQSLNLVFNHSDKTSLIMSFLKKYFRSPKEAKSKEWAIYSHEEHLKYKYELLIRQIKFEDLDYGAGLAFSTQKGERMTYEFNVEKTGDYVFAYRSMTPSMGETNLKWSVKDLSLKKGKHTEVLENNSEIEILNVVGLIPKEKYEEAEKIANSFVNHFAVLNATDLELTSTQHASIKVEEKSTLKYEIPLTGNAGWIIFSDKYNPLWKIKFTNDEYGSVPVYSMINAFYVQANWNKIDIEYKGQRNFRIGVYFSGVTILILFLVFLLQGKQKEV